jgi:hypothetical protein
LSLSLPLHPLLCTASICSFPNNNMGVCISIQLTGTLATLNGGPPGDKTGRDSDSD